MFFVLSLFANKCTNAYGEIDPIAKKYTRIDDHINEYHSSCNVVYAYSVFLGNPSEMDELEKDNVYAEHLGEFAGNYPYIARFIVDREAFELFNRYYSEDKHSIDSAIKRVFSKKELKDGKNLSYVSLALSLSGDNFSEKQLSKTMKHLKERYTFDELGVIVPFWEHYKTKYYKPSRDLDKIKKSFESTVEIYGISLLEKYLPYANDFYPTLLPEKYDNDAYKETIKSLLGDIKYTTFNLQAYFLKNISIDIEVALANGNSKEEILYYLKAFIKRNFIVQFGNFSCFEKEGLAMLVTDNLDYKLDWIKSDPELFSTIIRVLSGESDTEKMINILGLYNYASMVYAKMETSKQKEMFSNIVKLPTDNIILNLSLIYALDNSTNYFDAIVNNPDAMYVGDKYKEILYVSRNDKMILNLFKEGDGQFIEEINDLVSTPYQDIHDLTTGEIIDKSIEIVDYASCATILIPGAGVALQIGKALAKTTAKGIIKKGFKTASKDAYKLMKNKAKAVWEDKVKYTGKKPIDAVINKNILKADQVLFAGAAGGITYQLYNYFYDEEQKNLCTGEMK